MTKTIKLPAISQGEWQGHTADIDITLKQNAKGQTCFSASGSIWSKRKHDYETCGQCLEEIAICYPHNEQVQEIVALWRLYHLNDMKAGVPAQENAIKAWLAQGNKYTYDGACEYLKSQNLYEVEGYKYGHAWVYSPIPKHDLKRIEALLN